MQEWGQRLGEPVQANARAAGWLQLRCLVPRRLLALVQRSLKSSKSVARAVSLALPTLSRLRSKD